ncbi:MAG: hypothetical protein ACHQ0J_01830 [Candidatus Dormibacterales bacterium]
MLPLLKRRVLPLFETPGGPGGGQPPGGTPPPAPEQDVFTRQYVQELRAENASWRGKLRDEQAAHAATRRQLGLDRALTDGLNRHALDPKLARAMLATEPERMSELDGAAPDIESRVDEALTRLARDFPQLTTGRPAGPVRNGLPLTGGGQAPPITRAELKYMTPEQIAELHRTGALRHLSGG